MSGKLDRLRDTVTAVAAILTALVAVTLILTHALGGRIVTVLSGSMEPTYHTGSLLFIRPVDPAAIEAGDVIAYMVTDEIMVTHRVVEVLDNVGVRQFRTKGDANSVADEAPVDGGSVVGTPAFSVPFAGYVVNFAQHPPGSYITMVVMLLILAAAFLPALRGKDDKKTENE